MNLKKLFVNASVLLAGTALAVLIPVKAQAAGLISGGASRELNSSSSTLSETIGNSTTRTVTVQITEPSEVIEEEYLNLSIALFSTNPKYCNVRSGPGTEYSIVGRMYDGSVGSIIDESDPAIADDEDPDDDNDQWIRIRSGAVEGYVLNNRKLSI